MLLVIVTINEAISQEPRFNKSEMCKEMVERLEEGIKAGDHDDALRAYDSVIDLYEQVKSYCNSRDPLDSIMAAIANAAYFYSGEIYNYKYRVYKECLKIYCDSLKFYRSKLEEEKDYLKADSLDSLILFFDTLCNQFKDYRDYYEEWVSFSYARCIDYYEQYYYDLDILKADKPEDFTIAICYFWFDTVTELAKKIFDVTAQYFQKNSYKLYSDLSDYAEITMWWLLNNEKYEEALNFYESIKANFPGNPELQTYELDCWENLGYYDEDLYARRKAGAKQNKDFKYDLGWTEVGQGNMNGIDNIHEATECIGETSWDIDYMEGYLFYTKGDYFNAIQHLRKSIQKQINTDVVLLRGICYNKMAELFIDNPMHSIYYKKLAYWDYKSVLYIEKSRDTCSSTPYAYAMMGKKDSAITTAKLLIKMAPDSAALADSWYTLAEIYCLVGNSRKAKSSIKEALAIDHTPWMLSVSSVAPFLSPIKRYVNKLVTKYSEINNLQMKRRKTVTYSAIVDFERSNGGGTFYVDCNINGIKKKLLFDTGADYLCISSDLEEELRSKGLLTDEDSIGVVYMTNADNESIPHKVVRIKEIAIGNSKEIVLHDINAAVIDGDDSVMLLGQTVYANLKIEIDPLHGVVTFTQKKYLR